MNFNTVKTIFTKELASFFNTVSSYVVVVVFLLLWEFLFFRNAFIVGESSLRGFFELFPWIAIILVPAITMGAVSRETDDGTLEILLTKPVREGEVLVGKWLAAVSTVAIVLLFTLPTAIVFSIFGAYDWGAYIGQFLGALFLGAALAALGVFVSSLLRTQIASLLVSIAVSFLFLVIGSELVTASLPLAVVPIFERLSLSSHYDGVIRGVLDTRDVWYFLSFVAVMLGLAYLELLKRKYGNVKRKYAMFQTAIILFIGIVVLTNLIGDRIPGRLDITQSRSYTVSSGTKTVMKNLPDIVTITLYATSKLPPQYAPILRETKDILRDLKTAAGDKLVIVQKDPSSDQSASQEAQSRGIQEVQFNVIGAEELQVKTGYLGLAIDHAGKNEIIPFIENVSDLEYQLVSLINKLTIKDKKVISVLSGHGEKSLVSDLEPLNTELEKQFTLTPDEHIATGAAALLVAGPTQDLDASLLTNIKEFIGKGGNILWLVDTSSVSPQSGGTSPISTNATALLKDYGITVEVNTVYDVRSHELVTLGGQGGGNYVLPYPFWVKALPAKSNSPILTRIQGITLPWPSSLTTDEGKIKQSGYALTKLITTSPYAGTKTGSFSIQPGKVDFDTKNLQTYDLAVSLSPTDGSKNGKMVIVGDSDFATSDFIKNSPNNGNFMMSAVGWLAQEDYIASIGARKPTAGRLLFKSQNDVVAIKYGIMAFSLLLPALYGFWRISARRRLASYVYHV